MLAKSRVPGLVVGSTLALAFAACGGSGNNGGGSGGAAGAAAGGNSAGGNAGSAGGSGGSASGGSGGMSGGDGGASGAGGSSGAGGGSGGASGAGGGTGGASGAGGGTGGASGAGGGKGGAGGGAGAGGAAGAANAMMNFFVTSDTSMTGNLMGLTGADARCQKLAATVGAGGKTWRAYLSIATPLTNARDRIGPGPYFNSMGAMVAADKTALHARAGDSALFIDEKGGKINGQWQGSPQPNQHDILTGTQRDGTLAMGLTCGDWTATTGSSQVGHSDGLGPNMATSGTYSYWNAAHTGQCSNTQPGGGAGRLYCFVGP